MITFIAPAALAITMTAFVTLTVVVFKRLSQRPTLSNKGSK